MPHYNILLPLDNIIIKCIFFLDGENSLAWCWLDLDDAEVLKSVLKRMKEVPNLDPIGFLAKQSYQSSEGNTVLHNLAKNLIEYNDIRLEWIMDLLEAGSKPNLQNKAGKTFLQDSNIKHLLLKKIENSHDKWGNEIFKAWVETKGGSCHITDDSNQNRSFAHSCYEID